MIINVRKIFCVYLCLFFRIGTFQWVTPDSNKKFSRVLGSAPNASGAALSLLFRLPSGPRAGRSVRRQVEMYNISLWFSQYGVANNFGQPPRSVDQGGRSPPPGHSA